MPLELIRRLPHQRHTVGEKQHALHPPGLHQQVTKRDHRARLSRAGRHHQQGLALLRPYPANRALLVPPPCNLRIHRHQRGALSRRPALHGQLQLIALVKALHLPRRIRHVIPQPVLIPVRAKDHRPLPKLRSQAIGVQLGLLLPGERILPGTLGLHKRERPAIVPPQNVIHKAVARPMRHPCHPVLTIPLLVQRPTRLPQQQVDKSVPGLGLRVVMRVRRLGIATLGFGNLRA